MNRLIAVSLLFVVFVAAPVPARAQAAQPAGTVREVTLYELVLRDGSRMYGSVERQDAAEVVFRTQAGAIVTARTDEISSLTLVTGSVQNGEFLRADPNATRLFFAPTGRSLKKGQVYLGVYEFVMPFVQVGVTDRISIGGGTPLVFGIDEWDRPFWVTPKVKLFDSSNTQVAVGVLHAFDRDGDGGGVGYVVGSRGGDDKSLTIGAGLAYGTNGGGRSGLVMLGGEARVRRNLKLITENYLWKDGNGVASAGVRFFGDRLSADLALGFPIGSDEFFAFPIVNFVYVF